MIAKVDVTLTADVRAILGSPGTGKSHYTKNEIKKAKRVIVWDLEDEYQDLPAITLAQLPPLLNSKKAFRARFVAHPGPARRAEQFDYFCRMIFKYGNALVVVEEMKFITKPSQAPESWAMLTLRGRKRGVRIIGTSQRPAQVDKDFLGNCTLIRCGALVYPEDRKAVADATRLPLANFDALTGYKVVEWRRDS